MNWFTKSNMTGVSDEKKIDLVANWGGCDHVVADPKLLHIVSYENDTWGREGYGFCEECWKKCQEEVDNEEVVCPDCKKVVKKKDTITWKWYDFYAPSGDTPLVICKNCVSQEKHKKRIREDRYDYEREFPCEGD